MIKSVGITLTNLQMIKKSTLPKSGILFLFLIATFFSTKSAYATHAMGADLTYRCLGNNQYEVTYSFYRDCGGITPSNTMSLDLVNVCTGASQTFTMNLLANYPIEITPLCPTATSNCNGGSVSGVQEWIYRTTITIPPGCTDWRISHTEVNRNGAAITTLTNPGDLYVYSTINTTLCNNSPTFSNRPIGIICVNQPFTFNHGAVDADGDSLVYSLITPLEAWGNPVTYNTGYSNTQFVQSSPPIVFSGTTGDIRMTPVATDVTVFAVLVSEYRNGVLIGQVERDIQLRIVNCSNLLPQLLGINGTPSYNVTTCANQQLCFNIASVDGNAVDTTTITWNNAIPGATFTTTGTRRDTARFCWTPTINDVSVRPRCFTATVRDNACPYRGLQVYTYCIRVNGVIAFAGPDQTISCGAVTDLIGSAILGNGSYNYSWSPNGVNNDTLYNATVGTYVLTITSQGCTDTDTVNILPGVGGSLAAFSAATNCQNRTVNFVDQSSVNGSPIGSWQWNFGDNTTSNSQNPTHTYTADGTYNVSLIVSSTAGCTDTIIQQVVVSQNIPVASFATTNVCQGSTVNFTDQSTGVGISSWSWNFGEPSSGSNTSSTQSPSHLYASPGVYNVTLTVTNTSGCQSTINSNVTVNANPTLTVAGSQICEGGQTTLTAPNTFNQYVWSNGSGASSITVSPVTTTTYTVIVTDANNCTGSTSATVTVNALPVPNAGNNQTICQGSSANLTASGGVQYAWTPGNLSGASVTVSPSSTTSYVVTVSNAASCTATASVTVNVNPMPQVDVSSDAAICAGSSITLSVLNGSGNLNWTPGNLNSSSITVSPAVTTTYYLTVSDGIGCSGMDSVRVQVNALPQVAFSQNGPVCLTNSISFTDQTTVPNSSAGQWNWSFGDNQFSTAQNPSHTYGSDGAYTVKLIVRSTAGCIDSTVSQVTVNPLPVADAGSAASICPGFNTVLNGAGGSSYLWTPGNLTANSITVSPAATTEYTLTVTDANGCQDIDNVTVTVNPSVNADAGNPVAVCNGNSVTLNATGGDTYQWTPGNINTQQYTFTPVSSGTYSVLVTNSFGCTGTDQVDVTVNPIPVAAFGGNTAVCNGNSVSLIDQSNINSGTIASWAWDFGNGNTSNQQNPSVLYNAEGTYPISLTITSDAGCQNSIQQSQIIWARPTASFTNTNVCFGNPVDITGTSTISDGSALNYAWSLNDGSTFNTSSFSHQFAGAGTYDVALIVSSSNGCVDSTRRTVAVYPLPVAAVVTTPACEMSETTIQDASSVATGNIASWSWAFGDGETSTVSNPTHTYTTAGDYQVNLLVVSDQGCRDSIITPMRVIPRPLVNFTGQNVCYGFPVSFTNLSAPVTGTISQYQWSFGDGGVSADENPVYIYRASGWFNVTLMAVSDSGCSTTRTINNLVNIFPAPTAAFEDNATDASDIYPLVNFYNQSNEPGVSYWSFGDNAFSTEYSPIHQYPGPGAYEVQLVLVNVDGCVDTTSRIIEIRPTSTIYIPNAFTPNGDLKNDFFQVYSSNMKSMQVAVYDRWGLKICEWDNESGSWDGKVNGAPAQADVYVYRVVTVDARDKKEVRLGHVSLVR